MTYTLFDRFIAWRRFRAVLPYIKSGALVCDLGCAANAPFLQFAGDRVGWAVGVDLLPGSIRASRWPLIRAEISRGLPMKDNQFDHVVMLAVLEHLPRAEPVLGEAHRILRPGGTLILTWPSALVDPILAVFTKVGFVGRDLGFEQHQPRIPRPHLEQMLKGIGFETIRHSRFELGLNNLLVAAKGR